MSDLRRDLADAQDRKTDTSAVVYRLYTENKPTVAFYPLIHRYFQGATLYTATGIWQGSVEPALVIEIVGVLADLQNIVHLAGDIKVVAEQQSVLVTWQRANSLTV